MMKKRLMKRLLLVLDLVSLLPDGLNQKETKVELLNLKFLPALDPALLIEQDVIMQDVIMQDVAANV